MKKTLFSIALLLLAVLLVLQGCTTTGNGSATPTPVAAADTGETVFTLDELLQFDGSNGQPRLHCGGRRRIRRDECAAMARRSA